MPNGKDTQAQQDVHDLIASLPSDDAVAAARRISAALAALHGAGAQRVPTRDIGALDAALVKHTGALLREYLDTARHTRQRESDLWQSAHNGWRELAAAYLPCVQGDTVDAKIAAARALRALRRQFQWLLIRFLPPPAALWESLARLYVFAEAAGSDDEIAIYPGETTTLEREFLKSLALSILTSDNLMPPEQDLAAYVVGRVAGEFLLSRSPDAGATHSFDLAQPAAPVVIDGVAVPHADLRYFGAGAAVARLQEMLRTIEQTQQMPAALDGFITTLDPANVAPVLQQMCLDWAGTPQARRQPREKTNARVSLVPGFRATVSEIERSAADPFDFTAKDAGESWIASDISPDGFGVVMPAVTGDWVSVGNVAGIEGAAAGTWSVGIVRRVRRLDNGRQHIGVQVLSHNAQPARVMREATGAAARLTQRMPVDRAILLTADAARQKEIELLVSDASLYGEGPLHVLAGDSTLLVSLREVLETSADCARISLTVLGLDK
jgi:hypothetical protein